MPSISGIRMSETTKVIGTTRQMGAFERLSAIASDIDTMAGTLQRAGSNATAGFVILNDQKFCHGGDICHDWSKISEN